VLIIYIKYREVLVSVLSCIQTKTTLLFHIGILVTNKKISAVVTKQIMSDKHFPAFSFLLLLRWSDVVILFMENNG